MVVPESVDRFGGMDGDNNGKRGNRRRPYRLYFDKEHLSEHGFKIPRTTVQNPKTSAVQEDALIEVSLVVHSFES